MNELKQKRKELGLTQIEAAQICGISRRTYQYYEENERYKEKREAMIKTLHDNRSKGIISLRFIKRVCKDYFKNIPEVRCAYLYGSYSRNEATPKSDIDILVVCHAMGMSFFGMAGDLEEALGKVIDLQTHRQIGDDEKFLENILVDGILLYKKPLLKNSR